MRMISAYILTTVKQDGKLHQTLEQMQKIKQISSVSVVSGNYDLMILTNVNTLSDLYDVTSEIQSNPSIIKTSTQVIEQEIIQKHT